MPQTQPKVDRLESLAKLATARIICSAVLRRVATVLPIPLIYIVGALTVIKALRPGSEAEQVLLWIGAGILGVTLALILQAAFARRSRWVGARALDRHYALSDRISNALAFSSEKRRSPLMAAAIDDAIASGEKLSASAATPIRLPKELLVSALLGLAAYGISTLEVRTKRYIEPSVSSFTPLELHADDVALLRELAERLERETEDQEVASHVRRFNQLVEDISERRLDRRQIFKRLEELEQSMQSGAELDAAALDEGLKGVAKELRKSELTKKAAKALAQKNLPDAEKALKELAERLKRKPNKINRAQLERLRKALDAAGKNSAERLERLAAQRRELEQQRRRLLKKKNEGKPLSNNERQALRNQERRLKRLDRQKKQSQAAQKALSQLDRDLIKAAQALQQELGEAGKNLESGAEDIRRMAQRELSNQEKEALKKQLEELRQLLRQHKKGGKKRQEMLERFRKMARGQSGRPGKPGQGQQGGQGKANGKGQRKPGQPGLGQGQETIEIPVPGAGNPSGAGNQPGPGAGSGSGGDVRGAKTDPKGRVKDVAAAGIDTGEGTASSEVVYGAAERGFRGRRYKRVYTDYHTVAEEAIESDEIPPGYKAYVRRYFQLIRPRE